MLQFATTVCAANKMCWVMVPKDRKGLFELVLFDVAMGGEVSTSGTSRDEIFSGEEG